MDQRFKQRLTGAVVLIALAVIFIPMFLSGPVERTRVDIELDIPAEPAAPTVPELPAPGQLEQPIPGSELADQPIPDAPEQVPEQAPDPAAVDTTGQSTNALPDKPADSSSAEADALYIQVGAFGSTENAERLAQRLRDDDFAARVVSDAKQSAVSHRVQVGPLATRAQAEQTAQALADQHGLPGFIVEP